MHKFTQSYIEKYIKKGVFFPVPDLVVKGTIKEILAIAEKELKKPVRELVVLDIGSGLGEYSFELEKSVKRVVGVEPFDVLYNAAVKTKKEKKSKAEFSNLLIEDFDSREKFDLAISLTTIEHMPNAKRSFKQVFYLLKPGGIIYLTAPNKWWPFEPHYDGLPFLGWLPLSFANLYLRVTNWGGSYEDCSYARSYFGMKKLFNQFSCTYSFYLPSKDAAYLGCAKKGPIQLVRGTGIELIRKFSIFWAISKGFIMIIKKNNNL